MIKGNDFWGLETKGQSAVHKGMPSKHALAMVGAAVGALVLLAVATIATNSAPITMTALDAEHVPLKKALKSLESSPVVNGVAQALESSLAQTYQRQRLIKAEHAKPLFVPKPVHKPLKYGDKITLRDAYNEYILCSRSGQLSTGRVTSSCSEELSFSGCADHVQIVSAKGKKGSGEVQYGDSVALIGRNGKYFMVRYTGKLQAQTSVLAADTTFKILGGHGKVFIGDSVSFKSEFGFVTGGSTLKSTVAYQKSTEKFEIIMPNQKGDTDKFGHQEKYYRAPYPHNV